MAFGCCDSINHFIGQMRSLTFAFALWVTALQHVSSASVAPLLKNAMVINERRTAGSGNCSTLGIATPSLPGGKILSFTAQPVANYSFSTSAFSAEVKAPIEFCNVTIIYTHTGWNDTIITTVWLPLKGWNGRFIGTGGGGLATRSADNTLAIEVAAGRAAVATDGGHSYENSMSGTGWALDKNNKVNILLLRDFASVTLNEAAILGKAVVKSFYGTLPTFSYWNGCSSGGRQGLMMAQRYPTAYDGIVAAAPAINWVSMVPASVWPTVVMNELKTLPPPCIFDAIQKATINACDKLDGLVDGLISAPDRCKFDPDMLIGQSVDCGELGQQNITKNHATVVKKILQGATSVNGSFLWYGLEPGTAMSGFPSLSSTSCVGSINNCTIRPHGTSVDWVRLWILQDPTFNINNLTHQQFDAVMAASKERYQDIIATNNPDLSGFRAAGGKMITWHGLTDQMIHPKGSRQYYTRVEALDPNVRDFYRYYEAPGVTHCAGGPGPSPISPIDAVIAWVENGTAPATLPSRSSDGTKNQELCVYPLVSVYKGGDKTKASSFACESSFPDVIG